VTEWTAPQTDELRRLVKAGYSNAEIARRFGMTPSAVREKCRRIGIRRLRHRTTGGVGWDDATRRILLPGCNWRM
jgi:hypothetical protein